MRLLVPLLIAWIACPALADEAQTHRFDKSGGYQPAGWPDQPRKLLALAGKPLRLHFPGIGADWKPAVRVYRVTSARRLPIDATETEVTADGWQWVWTPPAARGPAHYEIRFDGEPKRVVRLETRDSAWLKATLEMLCNRVDWEAHGLSSAEQAALAAHGLQLGRKPAGGKNETASLQLLPRQGDAARRRVVWDEQDPALVVWRPGAASGDLEVRAPRWWISPEALATDQGLIRFLDLFSEPPINP